MPATDRSQQVLAILRQVAETDQVLKDPELRLYQTGVLDSLATVNLMAAFSDELGVEISPAEFDREAWATPRLLVEDVLRRLDAAGR
jgi:D-alanine--poly(phosphoribitol) ligase subunit 2